MTDALDELVERLLRFSGPLSTQEVEECIRLSPWYDGTPSHDPVWGEFCRALYGSSDAALALTERLLPGQWPEILRHAIMMMGGSSSIAYLPLAILIATLTALASLNREGRR
jgi:hypothetical protein